MQMIKAHEMLKKLVEEGMTQAVIEEMTGVSQSSICRILTNKTKNPTSDTYFAIKSLYDKTNQTEEV